MQWNHWKGTLGCWEKSSWEMKISIKEGSSPVQTHWRFKSISWWRSSWKALQRCCQKPWIWAQVYPIYHHCAPWRPCSRRHIGSMFNYARAEYKNLGTCQGHVWHGTWGRFWDLWGGSLEQGHWGDHAFHPCHWQLKPWNPKWNQFGPAGLEASFTQSMEKLLIPKATVKNGPKRLDWSPLIILWTGSQYLSPSKIQVQLQNRSYRWSIMPSRTTTPRQWQHQL